MKFCVLEAGVGPGEGPNTAATTITHRKNQTFSHMPTASLRSGGSGSAIMVIYGTWLRNKMVSIKRLVQVITRLEALMEIMNHWEKQCKQELNGSDDSQRALMKTRFDPLHHHFNRSVNVGNLKPPEKCS